jgi:hypothetical protein
MPIRRPPIRHPPRSMTASPRASCPRPWPALPSDAQRRLAQLLARLLRRMRQPEEAFHADDAE